MSGENNFKMPKKKVTDQQQVAIRELFDNGFSSKRDALDAGGYSKETRVGKVFDKPEVKAEIALQQKALARKHDIQQDAIVAELAKMLFYGVGDLIKVDAYGEASLDFTKLTANHRAGIKSFTQKIYTERKGDDSEPVKETKIEFVSKIAAQDALSKHLGFFEKDNEGAKDLIKALLAGRKRVRIAVQIEDE